MATDINEVYKKYPCAKKAMETNIKFFNEPFDRKEEPPFFDTWLNMDDTQDALFNFLEDLESYDMWRLKLNEITPDEENHNREVGRKLTKKYLNGYEYNFWHRINSMDWDLPDDESEKTKI